MKATWNGVTLAESDQTVVVERNDYFPADSLRLEFFTKSTHTTTCPWKGRASYFDIVVDGATNANAAWTYTTPTDAAGEIAGHVAFWKGVKVEE